MPSVNSTARRIAAETYQRGLDAIANGETEGAEFVVWWERLAGLSQGMQGRKRRRRKWARLLMKSDV
jgi:hypothetical protein